MSESIKQVQTTRVNSGIHKRCADSLAVEEPLEIVLLFVRDGHTVRESLSITMRTPGNDHALVLGFLFTEGVIRSSDDVIDISHRGSEALKHGDSNVIQVTLAAHVQVDTGRLQRNFYVSSSCGVCGKASLEALEAIGAQPILGDNFHCHESVIHSLTDKLATHQALFHSTGGTHAAAAFTPKGELLNLHEDVGRHNAMDKLLGSLLRQKRTDFNSLGVVVSARASFELLQKAAMAGFPVLVAVGAASSLAVELAEEFEITLIGFNRDNSFNLYTRADRIRHLE